MSEPETTPCVVVAGNPFDGMKVYGPFADNEDALHWAERNVTEDWWSVKIEPVDERTDMSDPVDLPEGLSPWRGKPGEVEILDAQGHAWVTLHSGANGDPIKWRNAIAAAVFVALGILPEEIAR